VLEVSHMDPAGFRPGQMVELGICVRVVPVRRAFSCLIHLDRLLLVDRTGTMVSACLSVIVVFFF
jgi:hypothetical protein